MRHFKICSKKNFEMKYKVIISRKHIMKHNKIKLLIISLVIFMSYINLVKASMTSNVLQQNRSSLQRIGVQALAGYYPQDKQTPVSYTNTVQIPKFLWDTQPSYQTRSYSTFSGIKNIDQA